jgi:hypothetical protein
MVGNGCHICNPGYMAEYRLPNRLREEAELIGECETARLLEDAANEIERLQTELTATTIRAVNTAYQHAANLVIDSPSYFTAKDRAGLAAMILNLNKHD